ncbi:hypothetical protein [Kineococcus sp. SYSU DK005]|uniref:hypothetical protein n=1 Tax=Kineococcus sp. SYSU DK005 TaxID=3383126 RepID=UPI003D7D3763
MTSTAALLLAGCTSSTTEPAPSTTSAEAGGSTTSTSSATSGQAQPFTVVESAHTSTPGAGEGTFVHWAALLRNPNTTHYGAFPVITVTARDTGGQVLASQQQTLNALPPGADIAWAGLVEAPAEPAAVEVTYATVEWYPTRTTPADYPPFTTTGVQRSGDEHSRQVVGELASPFSQAVGSMAVTVLYRDGAGKLLTGTTGYVDALPAAGTVPFSVVDLTGLPQQPAEIEVYAVPWGGSPEEWNWLAGA